MHATHNRREILKVLTLAALAARGASALAAETFPSKPIHMVVPYAAGGTTDQMARVLSQPMGEQLGQPIIVENRPGAGGAIGTDYVVRSRGDGYTLVFGNAGPNALLPLMRPIAYDPVKDLRPISLVAPAPLILAVSASSPARNLKEFLVYARKNDGSLNIGSVGNGSMSHLSAEYFNQAFGLKLLHVPYAGGAPMVTALLGGQLHAAFVTGIDSTAFERAGKIRHIAIGTPEPSPLFPGLPTISSEAPGFRSVSWQAIFAPKDMPDDIVARLHSTIASVIKLPTVQKVFNDLRTEAVSSTPEALAKLVSDDIALWSPVIRKANIQM